METTSRARGRWLLPLFVALAVLHTWPLATNPARLSRLDNNDTAFNTWVVSWVAYQLPRNPAALFQAPIFHPEPDALAFSEHMTVPALMGAPLLWLGVSPVLVYNLLVLAGLALSGYAMARLVLAWTASLPGGIVAGMAFAFNAHLLTRLPHLQALHIEFLPIVLYAFDRLLAERRTRHALLLAAAFAAQALCSNYTLVMMTVALMAAAAVRRETWRGGTRVWFPLALAAVLALVVLVPFLLPYARVRTTQGMSRGIEEVRGYSAGWADYLATAGRLHFNAWSHRFLDGRTALFPGITVVALGMVALLGGDWRRNPRVRMALAFGLIGFLLSFGASLPGYAWLHGHVPLLQGIRAVGRWGFLLLVALSLLAGFGIARLERRWRHRSWWPALALALLGLVTLEALRAPLALVPFAGIPAVHSRLRSGDVRGIIIFPFYPGGEFHHNAPYLLHQTKHWRPIVNGYSSFAPQSFYERAARMQHFPREDVLAELRVIGVTHVVLHRAPLEPAVGVAAIQALRHHPDLEFVLDQDGVTIYRLQR